MSNVAVAQVIPFKLYGETYAEVIVFADGYRSLNVLRQLWFRDEMLLLADFIRQHVG